MGNIIDDTNGLQDFIIGQSCTEALNSWAWHNTRSSKLLDQTLSHSVTYNCGYAPHYDHHQSLDRRIDNELV
jgi:hypothetical protein